MLMLAPAARRVTPPAARARPHAGPARRRSLAARARGAGAVGLVLAGLVLTPGLWFALAGWAWGTGWHGLAVPLGLLAGLALLLVGVLALRAAGRPGGPAGARWGR